MDPGEVETLGRWFAVPKFREEGPPMHVYSLLTLEEFEGKKIKEETRRRMASLIVLGYRSVTVSNIISILLENGNKAMYGAELGKALESRFGLPEGFYTKARYYEDRIGRLVRLLTMLAVLKEDKVKVGNSQRTTTGYKLPDSLYRLLRHGGKELIPPPIFDLPDKPIALRVCEKDRFATFAKDIDYCPYCGASLDHVCPKCDNKMKKTYDFCIRCGTKLR
jgi:hypothetical protein